MPPETMQPAHLQAEAVAVESLIGAALALLNTTDAEGAIAVLETAQPRAQALNLGLDSLHEVGD